MCRGLRTEATVQAAIGSVPLAAGVASGEVILAVAVLSILVTAPLGAIGITILGRRVAEPSERSPCRFKELRKKLSLPRVGERVRSKQSGGVRKIIEEKEMWVESAGPTAIEGISGHLIPAIILRFWREDMNLEPSKGRTMAYSYTQKDSSFPDHWEVLYDW